MNTPTSTYWETKTKTALLPPHADLTEQKLSETMPISENHYRSIVEKANQAVMIVQEGLLRYVNPKAGDLLGYPQQELISLPLSQFIHEKDRDSVLQMHARRLKGENLPEAYAFRMIRKNGVMLWVELNVGLFSWNNQPATLCFINDITQRIQTEEKYHRAIASRFEGFMMLGNDRIITEVNQALLKISGYRQEDFIGHSLDEFYEHSSVDFYSASADHFSFEALFRARNGQQIPMLFSRSTLKNENEQTAGYMYFLTDLTDLKATQKALEEAEHRYRSMYENAVQGMFQSRLSGRLIRANPAFVSILGYDSVDEVLSLEKGTSKLYFDPQDRVRLIRTVLKKGAVTNYEMRLKRKDGKTVWILANIRYVRDEQGGAMLEGIMVDNTRKKAMEEQLKRDRRKFRNLSIHDNLTGLFNTRYLYQELQRILEESKLTHRPFSLVFMDMDHFKQVVDTYGHLNGSQSLKEVAGTIKSVLKKPSFGVAYGGDEFVMVLPGFTKNQAIRKLEELRDRMQATVYLQKAELNINLSASFGVATFPEDAQDGEGLLALADRALFRVKQQEKGAIGVSQTS
jgi:diguanylate cyclase (GGDEF)-like protein/PAS domain S-box-containing protein